MKKAGIIGGIGPASTLDYYSGIINGCRIKSKDENYPALVINSINMTEMLSYVSGQKWDALAAMLAGAVRELKNAGAELAAIASNTPHIVFDKVREQSPLPLLSIVDATCRYTQSRGCRKVVVIGTRFTMSSGLYTGAFERMGIQAVVPSEEEQAAIHGIIFPKLEEGLVDPEDKRRLLAMARRLLAENNADGLILGCTELPLMIRDDDMDTLVVNTTRVHIDAIVDAL